MLQQRLATCVVVTEDMGMEGMVDTVDMEDMDTMERDLLKLKLKLSQDISEEDMEAMVMAVDMVVMVTVVDTMARGRLNQDILEDMVVMAVDMDMGVMDMVDMAIMVKPSFEFILNQIQNDGIK